MNWGIGDGFEALQLIKDGEHIVAIPGDRGIVIHVDDDGVPTVLFKRTLRSTVVGDDEGLQLAPILCIECEEYIGADYYMVRNDVWRKAVPERKGQLHLTCLEKRLGRQLVMDDFTDVPLNNLIRFGFSRGQQYADRLIYGTSFDYHRERIDPKTVLLKADGTYKIMEE